MAIARGPHASLQHASFELRGLDEYMRGSGRMMRSGWQKLWGPGRHRAGDNTFTYFLDPNGNTMEYTTELETVEEDTWHPSVFNVKDAETSDQWGTANDMDDFITPGVFNDPDKGFTSPLRSNPRSWLFPGYGEKVVPCPASDNDMDQLRTYQGAHT